MGYTNRSHPGNKVAFSQLDIGVKKTIAENVALELMIQLNRHIKAEALMNIFEQFDVDIRVGPEDAFTICRNAKLETAVKKISARF